jgi:monomeric sarcosine oxidase
MDTEVVVVGGGVMGLATAWRLALAGVDVVVAEQFDIGHERGSSHGPTRVFRFLYHDPVYVRMAQAALPLWRELEVASGESLLRLTGGVHVDAPEILGLHRDAMRRCGAAVDELTPDDFQQRFPWLDADGKGALFVPDMGVLRADGVVRALRDLARGCGAEIREQTPVEAIETKDEVTVSTHAGAISARTAVIAAGAWTADLLRPLGIDVPLRVTREQVVYFKSTDEILPFVHGVGHWIYGVPPFESGGALKVGGHGIGPVVSADDRPFEPSEATTEGVAAYVRVQLPTTDPEPLGADTCLYSSTSDGDFVVDRRGPIVCVSPCSGHGFKFAPLIGDIAAALALGRAPPVGVTRFALDRFS